MEISKGVLYLALLLTLVASQQNYQAQATSQPNYQERVIYYDEHDNACAAGAKADSFELNLILQPFPSRKVQQWAFTSCAATKYLDWDAISAADTFYYYDEELRDRVLFTNVLTKNYFRGIPLTQVVRTTVSNDQCVLRGKPCSCTVIGDGTKQHFGTNNPDHTPASITLDCKFVDPPTK